MWPGSSMCCLQLPASCDDRAESLHERPHSMQNLKYSPAEKGARVMVWGIPKQTDFTVWIHGDWGLCPLFITSNTILSHLSVNFIFQKNLTILNAVLNGKRKRAHGAFPSLNFSWELPSPGLTLAPSPLVQRSFWVSMWIAAWSVKRPQMHAVPPALEVQVALQPLG